MAGFTNKGKYKVLGYALNCITPAQRTEYAYRCQEVLRLLHNTMGLWCREGLTQTQWNKLPVKIQTCYPYQEYLSAIRWKDFRDNVFEPASQKIAEAICAQRELLKASTTWIIDVEGVLSG